jgi:hypothetical protein
MLHLMFPEILRQEAEENGQEEHGEFEEMFVPLLLVARMVRVTVYFHERF